MVIKIDKIHLVLSGLILLSVLGYTHSSEFTECQHASIQKQNPNDVSENDDRSYPFKEADGVSMEQGSNPIHNETGHNETRRMDHEKTPHYYFNEGKKILTTEPVQYPLASDYFLNAAGAADQNLKVESHINYADCMRLQGHYSKAIRAYQNAIDIESRDEAYSGLMHIYYLSGKDAREDEIDHLTENFQKARTFGEKIEVKSTEHRDILKDIKKQLAKIDSAVPTVSGTIVTVPSPKLTSLSFAERDEEIYRRFINGRLVYKGPSGERSFLIADVANSSGEFYLYGLTFNFGDKVYNIEDYLCIKLGYRQFVENEAKTTLWLALKFRDHAEDSPFRKVGWNSDIGLFWTWGKDNIDSFDYLTSMQFDSLSSKNLYELWTSRESPPRNRGSSTRRAAASGATIFFYF